MKIQIKLAYNERENIKMLFTEYTNILIEGNKDFERYLKLQNFDKEVSDLEYKYGLPEGRLYVLYLDDKLAGCIGLKKLDSKSCEMKRLYVREEFRGQNLGKILAEKIISDARDIGYESMYIDTLPFLERAINMYKNYGFYEIDSYNNSPMEDLVYLKLDL